MSKDTAAFSWLLFKLSLDSDKILSFTHRNFFVSLKFQSLSKKIKKRPLINLNKN